MTHNANGRASLAVTHPTRRALHHAMRLLLALALTALGATASAQPAPSASATAGEGAGGEAPAPVEVATDSPRAALSQYLDLCRAGEFAKAAAYLDLPAGAEQRGAVLARRLKAVLDRHVWFDLDAVSPKSTGNPDDGLPAGSDQLGEIPGSSGAKEPVRFVRRPQAAEGEPAWVFSAATVARVDTWFAALDNTWMLEHLPDFLLRPGPLDLLLWQWIALPLMLLVCWPLAFVLRRVTQAILGRLARRTKTEWDDQVLSRLGGPLTLGWLLALLYLGVPRLGLYQPADDFIHRTMRAGLFLVFFWTLARSVDVAAAILAGSRWAKERPASRSLIPLGTRLGKVAVYATGLVALLSELGYPVASLLAGLGLGGLALALAAQKTVENLFGAVSLGTDQPFRQGDFVRVDDTVGTVEALGLRSTRIRTLDRTLVSIPNGKLAEMRLETFAARDRIRLACTVGLVYDTSAAAMRKVLAGLERVLREQPKIWKDTVVVRFKELAASSLDIEVMAWFETSDWGEFQLIRQEVLLAFMEVVESAGSSFAFPTRTVHVVTEPATA